MSYSVNSESVTERLLEMTLVHYQSRSRSTLPPQSDDLILLILGRVATACTGPPSPLFLPILLSLGPNSDP